MAADAAVSREEIDKIYQEQGYEAAKRAAKEAGILWYASAGARRKPAKDKRRMATDPPVSEAQRRAMFAAKSGHSNLGIPKSVGEEFASADPGGKLPKKKKSK